VQHGRKPLASPGALPHRTGPTQVATAVPLIDGIASTASPGVEMGDEHDVRRLVRLTLGCVHKQTAPSRRSGLPTERSAPQGAGGWSPMSETRRLSWAFDGSQTAIAVERRTSLSRNEDGAENEKP